MGGPLSDLRVLDISTVLAGPNCARYLADFGADVIKVERPVIGDSLRSMAWRDPRDGTGLWWKLVNRNKRTIALDLKIENDRELFLHLIDDASVLVENFRPGVLESLEIGPAMLNNRNKKLVITRISGFGQSGPYKDRPGFATIAESMSGWAAISGLPDGPPMLPPIALTDEVTAIVAAYATMIALHSGVGQVVDVNLLETMFQIMGPLISLFLLTGEQQPRLGSQLPYTVPRGVFQCRDGKWVGVSASSDSVAMRVIELLGVAGDERFATFGERVANRDALNQLMYDYCSSRDSGTVIAMFNEANAAIGPVLDMSEIALDPHFASRGTITKVGTTPMQGLIANLSVTPGELKWEGRAINQDGDDVRKNLWSQEPSL